MRKLIFLFVTILSGQVYSHESSPPAICQGISGLQVITDYKPDETPFTRKTKTELYTSYSDESYLDYIMVDTKTFKNDFVVSIEILNYLKVPFQKFIFDKWVTDKDLPDQKITKTTLSRFIGVKLSSPFDKFINLSKPERKKIDIKTIPYSARFSIGSKNKKPICVFDFSYGSLDPED